MPGALGASFAVHNGNFVTGSLRAATTTTTGAAGSRVHIWAVLKYGLFAATTTTATTTKIFQSA